MLGDWVYRHRLTVFRLLTAIMVSGIIALIVYLGRGTISAALRPVLVRHVVSEMSEAEQRELMEVALAQVDVFRDDLIQQTLAELPEAEKEALYDRLASAVGSWQDTLPEPDVGRIAKRNHSFEFKQAQVKTNNAGLRSTRDYGPPAEGTFRIVCLGDSMVFGTGGPEDDRFCDQLGAFYRDNNIQPQGRTVETLALGIDSWTLVNEATYLGSRISDYAPDVILVMTLANDITDTFGINGAGASTQDFSPEYRSQGTAVFSIWPVDYFGVDVGSALMTDLSPQARLRWKKGMERLRRLETLQHQRGGTMVLSVLDFNDYFTSIYHEHHHRLGFSSPLIFTSFQPSRSTQLPHDPHPNRSGHRILANHFIHALHASGQLVVPESVLPPLHAELSVRPPSWDPQVLLRQRARYARDHLRQRIDFADLQPEDLHLYLGGFFPEQADDALSAPPFASLRSGWLMAHPGGAPRFTLRIQVPEKVELFPFELTVHLQGEAATTLTLETTAESGEHTITAAVPVSIYEDAIEVMLETESYWTTIDDARMKSFYLLSAEVE